MSILRRALIFLALYLGLAACASDGMIERRVELDADELARALGCTIDEIPFCTAANCRAEDYYCVEKGRALETIFPGIKN